MRWIVGIDEVGRGALAGPVVVAAAMVPTRFDPRIRQLGKLKDSKKLSPLRRAAWFAYALEHPSISFALAKVYPRRIERLNISRAANVAAERAFKKLNDKSRGAGRSKIFLDGGLFLGNGSQPRSAKTVIKGDEKFHAVALASVIAKVSRDRLMCRLAARHPQYGFEVHKGYGTAVHRRAIKKHGPSPAHRLTFLS